MALLLLTTLIMFLFCFDLNSSGLKGQITKLQPLTDRRIRAVRRRWAAGGSGTRLLTGIGDRLFSPINYACHPASVIAEQLFGALFA